jgi:hypothetical protein
VQSAKSVDKPDCKNLSRFIGIRVYSRQLVAKIRVFFLFIQNSKSKIQHFLEQRIPATPIFKIFQKLLFPYYFSSKPHHF